MRTQEQSITAERERSGKRSGAGQKFRWAEQSEKNERSEEREVAELERIGERAESAAHAAKACTVYNLYSALFRGEAWPVD